MTIPNINPATGIHYGIIGKNEVNPDFLDEILLEGTDLIYEEFIENRVKEIENEIENWIVSAPESIYKYLPEIIDLDFIKDLIQETESDVYESDGSNILYVRNGYRIITTEFELIVMDSKYFTKTRPCSPCFPNAGDLSSIDLENGIDTYAIGDEHLQQDY